MPRYRVPDSDSTRLDFMDKTIAAANAAVVDGKTERVPAALLAQVTAHYAAYCETHETMRIALGKRVNETAEAKAILSELTMYISHMWTAVYHRYLREKQPSSVLAYYGLSSTGSRPSITKQQEALRMADTLISGDGKAVLAGFTAIAQPTVAELQIIRDSARAETDDSPSADSTYDEAQETVATLRPEADRLIKEVRNYVLFSARNLDTPSQRRVLRNYGAQFEYTSGEKIDEGDETAVVEEVIA